MKQEDTSMEIDDSVSKMPTLKGRQTQKSSPSFGNKILRAVWGITWHLFYRPSPVMFHAWRRLLLRAFGASIGPVAHPYPSAQIWAPWNLVMGRGSCLGPRTNCYSADKIVLEADCVVSQGVHLCSAGHDFRDPQFPLITGPITIGRGAWIAAEAFIGPGVHIGAEAVVGARTVVVKDVLPRQVVGGNPGRVIGTR